MFGVGGISFSNTPALGAFEDVYAFTDSYLTSPPYITITVTGSGVTSLAWSVGTLANIVNVQPRTLVESVSNNSPPSYSYWLTVSGTATIGSPGYSGSVTLAPPGASPTPLPGALMLFGSVLAAFGAFIRRMPFRAVA